MKPEVQNAILHALQRLAISGFAGVSQRWSAGTSLTRWQQFKNWIAKKLHTNDKYNWYECKPIYLTDTELKLIHEAMKELAPESKCRICGGTDLVPDPSDYYRHAERYDGAPLLCLNEEHK